MGGSSAVGAFLRAVQGIIEVAECVVQVPVLGPCLCQLDGIPDHFAGETLVGASAVVLQHRDGFLRVAEVKGDPGWSPREPTRVPTWGEKELRWLHLGSGVE